MLALVLVAAVVGGGGWLVGFSSVLATERVEVTGNQLVTRDQVLITARVPLGRPLARQDLDSIAANLLELPAVQSARVRRDWPHTVDISVVERTPLIAVRQGSGGLLVDRYGIGFASVSEVPKGVLAADVDLANLPVVTAVAAVAAELPPELRRRVKLISATSAADIKLIVSGVDVTWGEASDSALKAQVTLAMLKRKPAAINVSSPHNPAIRGR